MTLLGCAREGATWTHLYTLRHEDVKEKQRVVGGRAARASRAAGNEEAKEQTAADKAKGRAPTTDPEARVTKMADGGFVAKDDMEQVSAGGTTAVGERS